MAMPMVNITAPPVAQAPNITVCSGQNTTLTATGGGTYLWNNGNTNAAITVSPTSNTSYTVIVSFGSCSDTTNAMATVVPSPTVALSNDQTLCKGQSATLDAGNSGAAYLWNTGETSQSIQVTGAGTFWVFVALNNCGAKDTVKTFIAPEVQLSDSNLCTTSPIILDPGSGATSYLWSNGSTTQTITVDGAGSFWVVALFGSCLSSDSSTITGDGTGGSLYVPNAFTPNDDNLNEIFMAKGTGIATFDMNIFDRWGNLLFVSDDINKGWDGRIEGGHYTWKKDGEDVAQQDVYVCIVDYTTQCFPNQVQKRIGTVTIVK
jgi:gliding motility-associated-like protein